MKHRIRILAQKYAQKLKKNGIPLSSVYLFGSYAKGTPQIGSDIDICVVSPIFGKDITQERVRLMLLREGISDEIEPHPYSPEDFKVPYDLLASEIKRTGIKIATE